MLITGISSRVRQRFRQERHARNNDLISKEPMPSHQYPEVNPSASTVYPTLVSPVPASPRGADDTASDVTYVGDLDASLHDAQPLQESGAALRIVSNGFDGNADCGYLPLKSACVLCCVCVCVRACVCVCDLLRPTRHWNVSI